LIINLKKATSKLWVAFGGIIYIIGINFLYSDMFLQPSGSANHEAYVV